MTRTSGGPGPERPERGHDEFVAASEFARALDEGIRHTSDPALDRELALVAALRQAGTTVGPDALERDRMRRRLMAEFPSVVHEGTSPVLPLRTPSRQLPARTVVGRRRGGRRYTGRHHAIPTETRGRLVVAAAAAMCLLMSLSGMSLLLSRDAVPGDALYAFKRSAESAELGLTFGDERRALKHLEFAGARVSEIEVLADEADAAGTWAAEEEKFLSALDDFEEDTAAGTRLATGVAAAGRTGILAPLRGWAEQQEARLSAVRGALPLPAGTRLDSALELLDNVIARVAALERRADCATITSGARDELGLLPARDACRPTPPSGNSAAAPESPSDSTPTAGQADSSLIPPGLLAPPSGTPAPDLDADQRGALGLPRPEGGLLPDPGEAGDRPLRPSPEGGSGAPDIPLPLSDLPLLPLLEDRQGG